jgi:hypothetical protein
MNDCLGISEPFKFSYSGSHFELLVEGAAIHIGVWIITAAIINRTVDLSPRTEFWDSFGGMALARRYFIVLYFRQSKIP